ncbi:MAG: hypothetical protein CVV64_19795 [Candidatus Wallbacteria bacterium HGW-Wallbacteria-1]|jgi:HAE1 family hydrophobic/amphiphilic exporter-1|uniref:AcrB/AcrD/AcrF family protein n=1 Tax=Candidatus Wallbacteria bacterium HGW-Wallbacteria-1 TaxID=2013854 RepID=A0A2N1PIN6_9BACT|nr:MAG: hypothetical protein CVV64_19795 [Candidatus Wallbacteria bacterium HGW-Wallbacteria-1]
MNIVELSVRRPVMMTMVIMFLMVMGAFSYSKIPVDMLPKVDFPVITITTVYPGAGPKEIESLICKPIEEAVISINGIDELKSDSNEGFGNVVIQFENKIEVDNAAADVREKVSAIRANLPDDAKEPIIMKFDINALPVINMTVSSADRPVEAVYKLADDYIKDELSRVRGVAQVDFIGARQREIQVQVSREALRAYGLSILSLSGLIAQKSLNIPSGHITQTDREYTLRMDGEFQSVQDLRAVEIPLPGGRKTILGEIASVLDTYEELREGIRLDGDVGVGMIIQKRSDANTTETARLIREKLDLLRTKLPGDIKLKIVKDRSIFIEDSVNDLYDNLYVGVLITAVILFLFLHSLSGTFVASISIPASIIATYSLVFAFGFTVNMMTLMALAISVGILVNNAIIVLENIYNHLDMGKDPKTAAIEGTMEIVVPVAGATLTNVVVFVPIAFMEGMIGKFFYQFGLTVAFATFVSLLVAFTMTPMLASRMIRKSDSSSRGPLAFLAGIWNSSYDWLAREYHMLLSYSLDHKLLVGFLSLTLLISSFGLAPYIGFEFITEPDQREFDISIKRAPGTSLTNTGQSLAAVERILSNISDVSSMYTKLGKTEGMVGGSSKSTNIGEVTVKLKKGAGLPSTDRVMQSLYEELAKLPDVEINMRKTGIMGSQESALQIDIKGPELKMLSELSAKVMEKLKSVKGSSDVSSSLEEGKPELKIVPRREKLRLYGITEAYLAMYLRGCIEGSISTVYREGDDEYDIRVQLDKNFRSDLENIRALSVITQQGVSVDINEIAIITQSAGPAQIKRKDRSRMVKISSNVVGRSLGEVVKDIQVYTDSLELPLGFSIEYSGTVKRMKESFESLLVSMGLAVVFTYMLLAALLESFIHPITILLSFPLSFIGILAGLFITGMTLSIFSLMAVVMLVGIVVNNGILMIEQIRLLRDQGMECRAAIEKGCPQKLRPIIMTAAATVGAMVPLAMGLGAGGEMRAPMAVVSIGGLLVSTVLSLFVIPIIYLMVENWVGKKNKPPEPFEKSAAAGG